MVFGPAWKLSRPNTPDLRSADGRGWICEGLPTASSTSYARVANGKHRRRNSAPAVPCTATSRSGRNAVCSTNFGSTCSDGTMPCGASNGGGRVLTDRAPRLPWAGKKTGKNTTDRGKLGVKRSVLTATMVAACLWAWRSTAPMCMTKGYFWQPSTAFPSVVRVRLPTAGSICAATRGSMAAVIRREARRRRYTPHIKSRGKEQTAKRTKGQHASLGRRGHRLVDKPLPADSHPLQKKAANYEGLLHLAFAYVTWKPTRVLG